MAYTVLARKYRSTTFDELVGQEHVARTLKRALSSGRIAHAFLFCGTRGTGKTSSARLLAKAMNCESDTKPVTEPCNQCASCLAVARGDDIDVIEIDAASNTGVDNVRDLISNSQYSPARSRFKIYIIDEVHMLSKSAFNALLKTLEEPPAHVKFILATTEPEKVLATILSRCQRYDFRNIPTREIAAHLKSICEKEKIDASDDALLLVAKAGAGSMRDALSLLDRLLSVGEKTLDVEMIEQLLGLPRTQLIFDLAQAIGEGNVTAALERTDAMIAAGLSPETLIAQLAEHVRNLLILRTCGAESKLVEVPGMPLKDLVAQAARFEPVVLSQNITILEELRRQVRVASAGRALVDATLVRLALAEQFTSIGELIARTGGTPVDQKKKFDPVNPPQRIAPAPVIESPTAPPRESLSHQPAPEPDAPVEENSASTNVLEIEDTRGGAAGLSNLVDESSTVSDDSDDALPAVGKVWDDGPKLSLGEIMKRAKLAEQQRARDEPPKPADNGHDTSFNNVEPVRNGSTDGDVGTKWKGLLKIMEDADALGVLGILSQGRVIRIEDGRAIVGLPAHHAFFVKGFEKNPKRDLIRGAVADVFGAGVGISFRLEEEAAHTPRPTGMQSMPSAGTPDRPQTTPEKAGFKADAPPPSPAAQSIPLTAELREALSRDPLLSAIIRELGGTILRVE